MKNLKLYCIALIAGIASLQAKAQFATREYLDINMIKASHMVHGDMWYNPGTGQPECEYPKGTGKHASYAGGIWLSGKDNASNVRVAATLFITRGMDFMPGPLDVMDTISLATSTDWARIWKVDASTIGSFLLLYKSGGAAAITASKYDIIKEWPAKGNMDAKGNAGAALTISVSDEMAPFVDANLDGIYNWRDGDYPKIKGDQMLWWVINDNGTLHTLSKGEGMKIEIHIAAYAYNRGSAVDRMLFYEYTLFNKSDEDYTNFRFANWTDTDLGNPFDDYIGVDSAYRMGVTFQGDTDGPNGLNSYGANPPIAGFSFVEMPGDTCLKSKMPIGSITTFMGTMTGPLHSPSTVPVFYNYMNAMDAHSNPMGIYYGFSNEMFNMNIPVCDSLKRSYPSDKRFVLSSSGITFPKNTSAKYSMIFMVTDTNQHLCPNLKYSELRDLADTAWRIYCNPLPLSVKNASKTDKFFNIYPNPAQTILYVQASGNINKEATIQVINAIGQTIDVPYHLNVNKYILDISNLASGVYSILYFNGQSQSAQIFVKE